MKLMAGTTILWAISSVSNRYADVLNHNCKHTVIIRALSAKASKRTEKPRTESSGGIFSVLPSCPTNKRRSNRNRSSTDNNETERER